MKFTYAERKTERKKEGINNSETKKGNENGKEKIPAGSKLFRTGMKRALFEYFSPQCNWKCTNEIKVRRIYMYRC